MRAKVSIFAQNSSFLKISKKQENMIGKIVNFILVILPNLAGFKQTLISVLIIAVVTIGITLIEKYIDYKFQNFETDLQEQVNTSVKEVIDYTETFYAQKVNKAILKYPEIDIKIESILTNCLKKIGAGKAHVAIFHNGSSTPNGEPFLKFTCTNEAIVENRVNIDRTVDQYQSSSYARIAYYVNEVSKNEYFIINDIEELKVISMPDYQAAKGYFIKSIAFIAMRDDAGRLMGVISFYSYDRKIDFMKNIDYLELTKDLVTYEVMLKYDAN